MNRNVLVYFRSELEKQAFLSASLMSVGVGGTKAGLTGMRAFSPLTKTKNLSTAERLLSSAVPGSTFSPQRMAAYRTSKALTGKSSDLIAKSSNNQALLDRVGDVGLEMIF